MNKIISIISLIVLSAISPDSMANDRKLDIYPESRVLYEQIGDTTLTFEAFDLSYRGYLELRDSLQLKNDIISVVDFSQPSTQKRFYLIRLDTKEVLFQDYVAHGKNTGVLVAEKFSNTPHSNQSSLGFFRTGETYYGKNGFSLRLDGLEKGINHLARQRAIVIHAANYAEETFINKYGRLGRSFGCPSLPHENYDEIIDLIKNGSLLFIYSPSSDYGKMSTIIN